MLTKIPRSKFDDLLQSIGISKCAKYEATGEYNIDNVFMGSIVIELTARPYYNVINSFSNCLLALSQKWFLFPRFTYLGSEESTEILSIPISPHETDAISWTREDQEMLNSIVSFHATMGGSVGLDLYICDYKGNSLLSHK